MNFLRPRFRKLSSDRYAYTQKDRETGQNYRLRRLAGGQLLYTLYMSASVADTHQ